MPAPKNYSCREVDQIFDRIPLDDVIALGGPYVFLNDLINKLSSTCYKIETEEESYLTPLFKLERTILEEIIHGFIDTWIEYQEPDPAVAHKEIENTIRVIEHLSYIMECVLIPCMGDGKSELSRLIRSLKTNEAYKIDGHLELASNLETALKHYYQNNDHAGNGELSSIMRGLWKRVVDGDGNIKKPLPPDSDPPLQERQPPTWDLRKVIEEVSEELNQKYPDEPPLVIPWKKKDHE